MKRILEVGDTVEISDGEPVVGVVTEVVGGEVTITFKIPLDSLISADEAVE